MVLKINKYFILIILIILIGCKPLKLEISDENNRHIFFNLTENETELYMFIFENYYGSSGSACLTRAFEKSHANRTFIGYWEMDRDTNDILLIQNFSDVYDTLTFNKSKNCFLIKNRNEIYCNVNQLPRKTKKLLRDLLIKNKKLENIFSCIKQVEVKIPPPARRIYENDSIKK